MSSTHISKLLDYEEDNDEIDDCSPYSWENPNLVIPHDIESISMAESRNRELSNSKVLENDISLSDNHANITTSLISEDTLISPGIERDSPINIPISNNSPSRIIEININPNLAEIPTAIYGTDEMKEAIHQLCLEYSIIFSRSVKAEPADVPSLKMKVNQKLWAMSKNLLPARAQSNASRRAW
jgi:hypothetical protein